mmetsp:Transcript_49384/g.106321  ORF Transcript_49384/g.106321 Transcript_49384/m.106321 type:complete len:256 (-) Transcript_49384:130-897(-)
MLLLLSLLIVLLLLLLLLLLPLQLLVQVGVQGEICSKGKIRDRCSDSSRGGIGSSRTIMHVVVVVMVLALLLLMLLIFLVPLHGGRGCCSISIASRMLRPASRVVQSNDVRHPLAPPGLVGGLHLGEGLLHTEASDSSEGACTNNKRMYQEEEVGEGKTVLVPKGKCERLPVQRGDGREPPQTAQNGAVPQEKNRRCSDAFRAVCLEKSGQQAANEETHSHLVSRQDARPVRWHSQHHQCKPSRMAPKEGDLKRP